MFGTDYIVGKGHIVTKTDTHCEHVVSFVTATINTVITAPTPLMTSFSTVYFIATTTTVVTLSV